MTARDPWARLGDAYLLARHLPRPHDPTTRLGHVTLLPHQHAAVAPLLTRLRRYQGALLADAPGLGKTYVALAVAHALHDPRPLVLAPAILRTRWLDAARETGARIRFRSIESLGRSTPDSHARERPAAHPHARTPLVIVDEAHHLRTMTTRRWHAAADLCDGARVLLLSATPIHNRGRDATTLAALFHVAPGSRDLARLLRRITVHRPLAAIRAADPDGLARLALPDAATPRTLVLRSHDPAVPGAIEALPPLPLDGDGDATAHARTRLALLHAWGSSSSALAAMLRRRIARCVAIEAACDAGLTPDTHLLRAWHTDAEGSAVQLALAPLLGSAPHAITAAPERDAPRTTRASRATHDTPRTRTPRRTTPPTDHDPRITTADHRAALEALLAALRHRDDDARARALRRIARWSAAPVVAFTRSRITARALWRRLRTVPGTALLTGTDAAIASGPVPRDELLAMLRDGAPHVARRDAHAVAAPTAVRLLVTTDVASEGLSLAGTRTVVHLDAPWTPARLAQRTGRAARLGAPVDRVAVVHLSLPDTEPCIARVRRTLARKAHLVARARHAVALGTSADDHARIAAIARTWALAPSFADAPHSPHASHASHAPHAPSAPSAPSALQPPHAHVPVHATAPSFARSFAPAASRCDAHGPWLVAFRIGTTHHLRTVTIDGALRACTADDWHLADRVRAGLAAAHATGAPHAASRASPAAPRQAAPRAVHHALRRWWAERADPLDRAARRASVMRGARHPGAGARRIHAGGSDQADGRDATDATDAIDAPELVRVRRAVDAALAGATPVERAGCVRGAERVRALLRGGAGQRALATLHAILADPVAARRWLAAGAAAARPGGVTQSGATETGATESGATESGAAQSGATPRRRRVVRGPRLLAAVPACACVCGGGGGRRDGPC